MQTRNKGQRKSIVASLGLVSNRTSETKSGERQAEKNVAAKAKQSSDKKKSPVKNSRTTRSPSTIDSSSTSITLQMPSRENCSAEASEYSELSHGTLPAEATSDNERPESGIDVKEPSQNSSYDEVMETKEYPVAVNDIKVDEPTQVATDEAEVDLAQCAENGEMRVQNDQQRSQEDQPVPDSNLTDNMTSDAASAVSGTPEERGGFTAESGEKSAANAERTRRNRFSDGVSDEILRDLLFHVNSTGRVPSPMRSLHHRSAPQPLGANDENRSVACSVLVSSTLESMWSDGLVNSDLHEKDAFMAAAGLVRPGVGEVLRKRREFISKELSRSVMGRLRPNPRPRRYSDMVHQRHVTSTQISATKALNAAKSRQTQAIRLREKILSKSHRAGGVGRAVKLSTLPKTVPKHVAVQMDKRSRRAAGLNQHIDWKFCYKDQAAVAEAMRVKKLMGRACGASVSDLFISEDEAADVGANVDNTSDYEADIRRQKAKSRMRAKRPVLKEQRKRPVNAGRTGAPDEYYYYSDNDEDEDSFDEEHDEEAEADLDRGASTRRRLSANRLWYRAGNERGSHRMAEHAHRHRLASDSDSDDPSGRPGGAWPKKQTNVLEWLVGGLNCHVDKFGDEIRIKRLYKNDLNILTQRINHSGFAMKSLSLRSGTKDTEYNVVIKKLAHPEPPPASGSRRANLSYRYEKAKMYHHPRHRQQHHQPQALSQQHRQNQFATCRKRQHMEMPMRTPSMASRLHAEVQRGRQLRSRILRRAKSAERTTSSNVVPPAMPARRRFRSDSQLCATRQESVKRAVARMEQKCAENAAARMMKAMRRLRASKLIQQETAAAAEAAASSAHAAAGSVGTGNDSDYELEQQLPVPASAPAQPPASHGVYSRSLVQPPTVKRVKVEDAPSENAALIGSANASASLSSFDSNLFASAAFRRNSPKKLIRKVYTGSSTLPKILNRKRPAPPPPMSATASGGRAQSSGAGETAAATSTPASVATPTTSLSMPTIDSRMDSPMVAQSVSGAASPATTVNEDDRLVDSLSEVSSHSQPLVKSIPAAVTSDSSKASWPDDRHPPARAMSASQLLRMKHKGPQADAAEQDITDHSAQQTLSSSYQQHSQSQQQQSQQVSLNAASSVVASAYQRPLLPRPSQAGDYVTCDVNVDVARAEQRSNVSIRDGSRAPQPLDEHDFELNASSHWPSGTNHTTVGFNKTKVIMSVQMPSQSAAGQSMAKRRDRNIRYLPNVGQNVPAPNPASSITSTPQFTQRVMVQTKRANMGPTGKTGGQTPVFNLDSAPLWMSGKSFAKPTTGSPHAATVQAPQSPGCGSNLKKLVHKRHVFRKILPKSPEGHQISRGQSNAAMTPRGTELFRDPSGGPAGARNSQLLKSLLEEPGSTNGHSVVQATPDHTQSPQSWNQPAHQSRGTWQFGKRATVLNATRTSPAKTRQAFTDAATQPQLVNPPSPH